MKKILLIVLACIGVSFANAQRTCGSHSHLQDQLLANPALQQQMDLINQHTQQYINNSKKTRVLVTIPVVFHVVYNTPAENISDAACIANLSQLNLDFARLNADASNTPAAFAGLAANTDIQFCLAVRDPLGNATTGITHTFTTQTIFSQSNSVKLTSNGGLDAWPRDQYLNIWVCNLGTNLLGYAQFPGGNAASDGVVVLNTSVGSQANPSATGGSYNLGRTATHEVGHWLGMRHIWGDDGGGCPGSGGQDDNIGDTPPQEDQNYGCPTYPLLDACATVAPGAMFMNYMDYVDDACMNMFTAGQAVVMQSYFAPGGFRNPLLSSQGCISVLPCSGTPNAGSIATNIDTLCSGNAQLTLSGSSTGTGISVQWESATTPNGPWGNAIGIGNNLTYSAQATPGVMYYRCVVFCATSGQNAVSNIIPIYSQGVTAVNGGSSLCSPGNITLTAIGIGACNWYNSPTATAPIFTGNPFNTIVAGNTTYYVNTGINSKYSVGALNRNIGATSTSNTVTNGLNFKVFSPFNIDTVFVYPSAAGTVVVNVQDSATGISIGVYSMPITAAQANTKVAVPVNINCNAVGNYKMIATGTTMALSRNTAGAVFPYTVPNVVSITRCITGNNPTTSYRYFYDWKISAGCATALFTVPIVVTQPVISVSSTALICNGASTTINANVTGSNYNYTINGGNGNATGTFNNILAGTYTVSATNTIGCSTSSVYTIAQPGAIGITTISVNNTGGCNGSISATGTGGAGALQYQINGGTFQSTGQFNNLCTGIYTICIKDANNCSVCSAVLVNSLTDIVVYATATTACAGSADGTITCNVVGGLAPYQYKLNSGAFGNANVFNTLSAGSYTIIAKDANNVTNTIISTIINSTLAITTSGTSAASVTACNGSILATATGGATPYTYNLNGGSYSTNNNFINVCNGTYTLCVKDVQGCIVCNTYIVPIIVPIEMVTPTLVQPCPNTTNGSITVNVQLGTAPYQYKLNVGAYGASNTFTNLPGGIYTVTAIDANNITTSSVVLLNKSSGLTLSTLGKIDLSCFNTCDGNIASLAINGSSAYSYSLNGGTSQSNGTFGNLCGGVYTIVTTDANTCTASTVYTIVVPPSLSMSLAITNIACNGMTNGTVIVTPIGGVSPYQYKKAPVPYGTYNYFNGLIAGTYTFYVKDKNNCKVSDTGSVTEPAVLLMTSSNNPTNGTITLNAVGGTPGYTYSINGGTATTNNTFTGLVAGIYSLQVTDSRGCKYVTATVLQAPTSVGNIQLNNALNIYPNPSNGIINITYNADNAVGILQIKIMNELGQLVAKEIMAINGKTGSKVLNIANLPAATYMIQIIDEHQTMYIQRIVVQ